VALFQGEDLIDVTTPDGRTLTLPRSAVPASLLQQQITSAPPSTGVPLQEAPTPTLPPPADAPSGVVEMGEPEVTPVVEMKPEVITANPKRVAKARAAQTAAQNSPQAKMAGADQQTQGAYDDEKSATVDAAFVEAAAQDLLGQANEDANTRIDGLFAKRAADADAAMMAEADKNDEISRLRKKIAGTKIDRTADHPIIGAIGVALAGIGSAMQNRYTGKAPDMTALDLFWKSIDRKVAAQLGDLELMEKTYGMSKDELGDMEKLHGRKLEMHNALIAGEADKAKRHLEEIIAKSASEKTKAAAKIMMAQIDERSAAHHTEAVRWGLEYNQRDAHQKAQIGLGYSQLGEQRRSNMVNEGLKREDMYLDMQKHLAGLKSAGDIEAYKAALKQTEEVGKRGIRDSNAELILTPEGKVVMAQAKQLEDEAVKTEAAGKADPLSFGIKGGQQRVEMLRERAAQLRGQAKSHAVLGYNDTDAIKVSDLLAAGQTTTQLIDRIKTLSAGRSFISKDDLQVKLTAMFNELGPNLKEAWQLGAWDKGSANLVAGIIGQDPTSEWNAGVLGALMAKKMIEDPNGFKGRLDTVVDGLEDRAKNTLMHRGAKFEKGELVLQRQERVDTDSPIAKAAGALTGTTPVERAENVANSGGVAARVVDSLKVGKGPLSSREDQASQIENRAGSLDYPGLDKKQATGFDPLFKAYKSGNAAAGEQIIASIANNAEQNPGLSIALMHNLRQFSPNDLYVKARMVLPKNGKVDEQMSYEETNRYGQGLRETQQIAAEVLGTLGADGKITNQEGWKELAQRAKTDPEAAKALLEIARQTGNRNLNATLGDPTQSVVKGGR
jgi:hypothetical protein